VKILAENIFSCDYLMALFWATKVLFRKKSKMYIFFRILLFFEETKNPIFDHLKQRHRVVGVKNFFDQNFKRQKLSQIRNFQIHRTFLTGAHFLLGRPKYEQLENLIILLFLNIVTSVVISWKIIDSS
jgi:hypothetical protein